MVSVMKTESERRMHEDFGGKGRLTVHILLFSASINITHTIWRHAPAYNCEST